MPWRVEPLTDGAADVLERHLGQSRWDVLGARDACLVALLLSGVIGSACRRMPLTALETLRLPERAWRLVRRWALARDGVVGAAGRLELLLCEDGWPLGRYTIRGALRRRAKLASLGRKLRAVDLLATRCWRDLPRVQCPWLGQAHLLRRRLRR